MLYALCKQLNLSIYVLITATVVRQFRDLGTCLPQYKVNWREACNGYGNRRLSAVLEFIRPEANKRSWSTEKARSHANYKPIGRGLPDISEEDKKAIADFKKLAKPAKTVNALGSNNMYYPWIPTVSDLNAAIPF